MNNLYNKIYEAVNSGIQKALILSNDQSDDSSVKFYSKEISTEFIPIEYRFVDMGTDVLWAEYNLGAYTGNKPKDWYGDYYAWGETETKSKYSEKTYTYNIKRTQLEPKNDIVTQILGNDHRMPTKQDYQELLDNTTNKWVKNYKDINGLNGMLFISKDGKTLFFPAAGYYNNTECCDAGVYADNWSSSLYLDHPIGAFGLNCYSVGAGVYCDYRYRGLPVRAIKNKLN